MKGLSLKDIARLAGVSTTTVSFVVNNKARENRISESVVKRIKEIIEEHNYRPNVIARGLRTGKSGAIGVVVEDLSNFFFGQVAKTIESFAYNQGCQVIFASTDNDNKKALDILKTLKHQQVDGFIITPTAGMKDAIIQLQHDKRPFVLFDRYFPDVNCSYVALDNYKGGFDITEALLEKGYNEIAFITISSEMIQMQERKNGFEAAMNSSKNNARSYIVELPYLDDPRQNLEAINQFIASNKTLDAIIFSTNYLGILGLECLSLAGRSIPADIAVTSFDDNDLFRLYRPSITVVAQPIAEMATSAITQLLAMLDAGESPVQHQLHDPVIIHRNSV